MIVKRASLIVFVATIVAALGSETMAVEIETVPVDNPGNADDIYGAGYGGVAYEYNIGKYEVSNAEYCNFLNAVATVGDPHGLYSTSMGGGRNDIGGISRSLNTFYRFILKHGIVEFLSRYIARYLK